MLNKLSSWIGLRYIRSKRRNQFISFVSLFSLIAMALGTTALIVVLSVMNGFDGEIKKRILSVMPHGFVDQKPVMKQWQGPLQELRAYPQVTALSPYIADFAMLSHQGRLYSVEFQGVEPTTFSKVSGISQTMVSGHLEALVGGKFRVVLGAILADQLGVGTGDSVILTLPQLTITPAGIFPRVKRFTVAGIFNSGAQIDQQLAFIHIEDAQKLLRLGNAVHGLQLKLSDPHNARTLLEPVTEQFTGRYEVRDWSETQGGLFAAVKMEKRLVSLLLMIIVAVAALNIVTSLVLMVADKRRDIAVLRTMGMRPSNVMAIFVAQGSLVGCIGVLIGVVSGCFLAVYIGDIVSGIERLMGAQVFDPSLYYITELPSTLIVEDVVIIAFSGIAMSILATLYPAYRASTVAPAEVLRYE